MQNLSCIPKCRDCIVVRFRSLKESDFGEYEIVATSHAGKVRARFTIEKTLVPALTNQALAIGIGVGVVIFWIICSILLIRHKFIYIRWKWRRAFSPVVSGRS